ncbi:MAG: GNAT family N-acetyltransferase, partial [Acidobacteriales bacterium]
MMADWAETGTASNTGTLQRGLEVSGRPGENMAGFMALRGWRIVEAAGCWWHGVEGRFFMSVPYHLPQDPDAGELDEMLRSQRALGARFPSVNHPGLPSGLYVCRRKDYSFPCVHARQRSQVRRGLEAFTVRPVEQSELLRQGLRLNTDTMARQGRYDPEFGEPTRWGRLVKAVYGSPAVVAYGAFQEGRLVAYAITCRDSGWLHLMHQNSRTEDLQHFPNHALSFAVTRLAAEDAALEWISFGIHSLIDSVGLLDFKLKMGYEFVER